MRKSFISLVFLAFCSVLVAQQAVNSNSAVKLAKAGPWMDHPVGSGRSLLEALKNS
jgi:hypothetical protein